MPFLRAIAYLWTALNTVIGLVFGLLAFQRPRLTHGIVIFDAHVRGSLLVLRAFRRSAITFGHVVLADRPVEGSLLVHELQHVRQYERLGPLYIPLYVLIWVFTGYRKHPFEEAARLAELRWRAA